jgi:cysteine desulfurase/selenocysteine lyase
MTKRRDFLKYSALSASALLLDWKPAMASMAEIPFKAGPDRWNSLRDEFDLSPGIVFLNNGTMGLSPRVVIEAVYSNLKQANSEVVYGGWEKTTEVLANYFGADKDEIGLTHNVTDGINIIAQGLPLKKGDEIIVSNQEHVGNALPWLARAQRDGLNIKVLDLTLPKESLLASLKSLISNRTKVIALPHIPCTTGRIIPAEEIGEIAKSKNIYYFLDGAHGAGMLDLDLGKMNCDFYATCTHKWMLGPIGTGFIFIRKNKMDAITPIFTGAYSDTGWNLVDGNPRIYGWSKSAGRHTNGTQNRALFDGVIAAVKFHESLGKKEVARQIRLRNDNLYEKLTGIPEIKLVTPENERAGLCAFTFVKHDFQDFYKHCREKGIVVRAVPENEINAIRVSTHIYNTNEEIDTFVQTLREYLHA